MLPPYPGQQEDVVQEDIGFLTKFLGYELRSAERYRRFISLVMVASPQSNERVNRLLGDNLRTSDVVADFDGASIILMSETNSAGALSAIERYKNTENIKNVHDLRFSLVTFPADNGGPESMIASAFRRLQKAAEGEPGAVIMTG